MARRRLLGALGGAACLFVTSLGHAECRMDNDCPGDLVCEEAACVAPSSLPPPPPAPPAPAPVARPQPTTPPPPDQARVTWQSQEPPPEAPPLLRRGKRHSQAMFVTGIVVTSLAPIGLLVTSVGMLCGLTSIDSGDNGCGDIIVGGLVTTAIFAGVGVPLIVIGAKRDPVGVGRIAPWVTPRAAGIGLRFDL